MLVLSKIGCVIHIVGVVVVGVGVIISSSGSISAYDTCIIVGDRSGCFIGNVSMPCIIMYYTITLGRPIITVISDCVINIVLGILVIIVVFIVINVVGVVVVGVGVIISSSGSISAYDTFTRFV